MAREKSGENDKITKWNFETGNPGYDSTDLSTNYIYGSKGCYSYQQINNHSS